MVTKFHFFLAIKSLRRNKSKFHSSIKVNNAGESSQYCSYARTVGFERPITNTSILMHALNKEFLISLCRLVCCPSIVSYCFLIIVHPPHPHQPPLIGASIFARSTDCIVCSVHLHWRNFNELHGWIFYNIFSVIM